MHLKLIVLFSVLSVATCTSLFDWAEFKRTYNKHYESAAEEAERKQIFLENANRIRAYKQLHPDITFTMGINHLADRRIDELVSDSKRFIEPVTIPRQDPLDLIHLPDSFDWRTKGVVTPVRDQGMIGNAEAFATVEVIESLHAIQTGKLIAGSVARVADCCPQPADPFVCVQKLGGICSAASYPDPVGECKPDACKPFATFSKIMRLKDHDETTMVKWIQNSTLFVGIDASQSSFQFYQSGIYKDPSCSKTVIDHAMQLVGYGKTSTGDLYWICRNSWGTSWGEQGYIRILRGQNVCGIASYAVQIA